MADNLLALDIGTQSTRAALISVAGEIVGIAQVQHEVDSPHPGWAQQRPDDWWSETCRAIQQVLNETNSAARSIAAIGTCGQMHGPAGVDQEGETTTPWVQLWCDKRCQQQADAIRTTNLDAELAAMAGNSV